MNTFSLDKVRTSARIAVLIGVGEGRPRGHQRGQFGYGDAPFGSPLTASGTARIVIASRKFFTR